MGSREEEWRGDEIVMAVVPSGVFNRGHFGGVALRRGWLKLRYLGVFVPLLPWYPFVFVSIDREFDLSLVGQVLPSLVVRSLLGYIAFFLPGLRKEKELTLSDCYEGNVSENINIRFLRGVSIEITSIYFHEDESYWETSKIRTLFYVNRTYANYSDLRLPNRCFHHLLSIFLNVYFSSYSIFHFSLPKILEV